MKSLTSVVFSILLFSSLNQVTAQGSHRQYGLSSHLHFGAILPEYSSFTLLTEGYTRSFDLMIEKRTNGQNFWQEIYGYPSFGLGVFATSLGNDEVHGHEIALFPYVKIPIVESGRFSFSSLLGLGLGYVTKTYNAKENPYNIVVGSHMNIHFQANFIGKFKITDQFALEGGLAFAHFSNANTAEPNIGINNLSASVGLAYEFGEAQERIQNEFEPLNKSIFWEVGLAPGRKSTRTFQKTNHFTCSFSGDLWKPISRVVEIGFGPDIFYDSSAETEMAQNEGVAFTPRAQWSSGIHASFAIRYDKLRIIIQAGGYIFLENQIIDEFMYNRAIFRYDIAKHFYVHFAMKSHLHILDSPEIGFGYRWKRN